ARSGTRRSSPPPTSSAWRWSSRGTGTSGTEVGGRVPRAPGLRLEAGAAPRGHLEGPSRARPPCPAPPSHPATPRPPKGYIRPHTPPLVGATLLGTTSSTSSSPSVPSDSPFGEP